MRHVLVIFNPTSGIPVVRLSRSKIQASLKRHGVQMTWIDTCPDDTNALQHAVRTPFHRIIVIGGDGTVRSVAETLIHARIHTPMAIVAQGTGNILASSLGIPLFPLRKAIDFALNAPVNTIDVLRVNKKHICLIGAGQGYDAHFIRGATTRLKQRLGPLAYAWSLARTFLPYRASRYTIIVDGTRHHVTAKLVLALNIFSVIGLTIERAISAHDGLIDVFVFHPRTLWETLTTTIALLLRVPRTAIPRLQSFQGTHVSIRQQKGKGIQIDGELFPDKHLDIEILPSALSIVHKKPFDDR